MSTGFFKVPTPKNEPVLSYAPGSKERASLKKALEEARAKELEIPMYIGADEVRSGNKKRLAPPHDHRHTLGFYHQGDKSHVEQAINAAMAAKELWSNLSWENRASIFLKAADLLAGPYRYKINAATMLGQSKNAFQAEIDSACELIDFLRFNVHFMTDIYKYQPESSPGIWNRSEWRPLEGFVFALTPFNFTAIAGNLPTAPALMGNTVVWKPAETQMLAAWEIYELLEEAGLPPGVINFLPGSGSELAPKILGHRELSAVHFTGSTGVFRSIWSTVAANLASYRDYP